MTVVRRTAMVLLVAAPAIYFGLDLGGPYLQRSDSFHTLLRAQSLYTNGDWLALYSNHAPTFKKPPLQYLLTAVLLDAGVDDELAGRLPSFAFAVALVIVTGALAGRLAPAKPWATFAAMALLVGSTTLWENARFAFLDTGQSFFLVASFLCALLAQRDPRWWIGAGIAVGLGFLQKTPVALVALGAWLVLCARLDPVGPVRWSRLRANASFRWGAGIALVLCASWPAIQIFRFGADFFDEFFVTQMFDRFGPSVDIRAVSDSTALPWIDWIRRDSRWIWPAAMGLVPVVLVWRRFREAASLRGIAWIIVAMLVSFSLAGGRLHSRYVLVLLPLVAALAAVALAEILPRAGWAAILCLGLMATSVPKWPKLRAEAYERDISEPIVVSRSFARLLEAGENPVFIRPRKAFFPSSAFVYYANLDRAALLVEAKNLGSWKVRARRASLPPPYLGMSHRRDLDRIRRKIGNLEMVEVSESYAIWRAGADADDGLPGD